MSTPLKLVTAVAVAGVLVAGGVSIAASGDTQITVSPSATLMPGTTSPFDAAGVKAIRRGKPIPSGYRLVGIKVTTTRGIASAGAALFFRCPAGKRLRTFGETGDVLAAADRPYVGHRQTWVRTDPGTKGTSISGIAYAVCR
jgi:hypothetical protein